MIELIQQHDDSPSVFHEGGGPRIRLPPLGGLTKTFDDDLARYEAMGYVEAYYDRMPNGSRVAYVDSLRDLPGMIELVEHTDAQDRFYTAMYEAAIDWDGSDPIRGRATGMSTVETVRGAVEVDRLGPTLMHEHVFVLDPEAVQNYGHVWGASYWDEDVRVADAIAKLRRLRDGGIETIVDPTAFGLGRFIPRLQRINAEVDLNIVVATGVYAFLELPMFLANRSDDWLVELFVREIREGIDDTGVKAAFLKCAVEQHGLDRRHPARSSP